MASQHRVVVVGGTWPYKEGNRQAANVITHQILYHLAREKRFALAYQYVGWEQEKVPSQGKKDLDDLIAQGVDILPPLLLGKPTRLSRRLAPAIPALLSGRFDVLAMEAKWRPALASALDRLAPDLALIVWSEVAQNLVGPLKYRKIAYAGNPDHKVLAAIQELRRSLGTMGISGRFKARLTQEAVRRSHLAIMRGFDRVLDVAANDAEDYRAAGVKADYIQNMWPMDLRHDWETERDVREVERPLRIVGNVGLLSATGNTFGLLTIANEILPRLKARLGTGNFEIHLFGGGSVRPEIAPLLRDPHLQFRGFVPDLDSEILAAPIFLVANNHHRFKVGHTRFLHAWSLGACCVAFKDSRDAMPEIQNERNALLAEDADDIVSQIARAASDRGLRRRMGRQGVATLADVFSPARVVARISSEILAVLAGQDRKTFDGF